MLGKTYEFATSYHRFSLWLHPAAASPNAVWPVDPTTQTCTIGCFLQKCRLSSLFLTRRSIPLPRSRCSTRLFALVHNPVHTKPTPFALFTPKNVFSVHQTSFSLAAQN
jgi:hypothetical protein